MTQEELDSLMSEGVDMSELGDSFEDLDELGSETLDETNGIEDKKSIPEDTMKSYKVSATHAWPPPPPTDDHKVVSQLDDVTRDSEVKATQIFDKLETLSNEMGNIESEANEVKNIITSQIELMEKLSSSFPNINSFKVSLENLQSANEKIDNIINSALSAGDEVMMAMDIMQYQDIHRQKIERVINVMRALSRYMNSLFEGKIDDNKRVSSAKHIEGDTSTEDVVSEDDIEALIAAFGQKKQ